MKLNVYRVTAIGDDIRGALLAKNRETHWDITANTLTSAWGKFTRQNFGVMQPNPADYDVRFLAVRSC